MTDSPAPAARVRSRLLIQCPDRPGIVAAVTAFLFQHGANVIQADQFSSEDGAGHFFMRLEYELPDGGATPPAMVHAFSQGVAPRFAMEWRFSSDAVRQRLALLVSRADHCLLEILWRWRRGELPVTIPLVISNHEALRADVEGFGIPFYHLPVTPETRAAQEARMRDLLRGQVDLVVLARYMQILSPALIADYPNRIINIHHSFLPAFSGADPYGQAVERGVKIIGATAHYATDALDEGPIIEQDVVRVSHRDRRTDLIRLGREVERSVLARALLWHIEDRVFVHGNKTMVFK